MNMRLLYVVFLLLLPLVSARALAADCDIDLKPTDTYKELSAKLKCLNNRINALEGSAGQSPRKALSQPKVATQVEEAGGIRVELEGCLKSSANIVCRIFLTATTTDAPVYIGYQSRAVNQDGAVIDMMGFQGLGEKEIERFPCNGCNIQRQLIKDAKMNAVIFFKNSTENDTEQFTALRRQLGGNYSVTFRNVLVRQG
jgi:hypothetical protein